MLGFGERLVDAMRRRGPLCVGIDPHAELLGQWGLPDTAAGLSEFCETVVSAIAETVSVVKPQSAFFERFGSAGIAVLESTIRHSREAGAIVILDVKRGDIGSTAVAYAEAYLRPSSALCADAITVSPYLGFGSIMPVFAEAEAHGGGVFVLAATSNPDGRRVQRAIIDDGRTVAQTVIDDVGARNVGVEPLGNAGVVLGATIGPTGLDLSRLNGPVLAPGLGAQGATADDLRIFEGLAGVVVPSYSREVLTHGPDVVTLRDAAARALEQCRKVLDYPFV